VSAGTTGSRYGIVETLTKETVTYVRPVFGLLKTNDQQRPEVEELTRRRPSAHAPDPSAKLRDPAASAAPAGVAVQHSAR
jgi:hypothetical protein